MFKTENIWLLLIIISCLLISAVLVSLFIDTGPYIGITFAAPAVDQALNPVEEPVAFVQGFQEGWQTFRSEGYAFEIQFPAGVQPKSTLNPQALNAGVGADPDTAVWAFTLDDPAYYRETNLLEASLLIHVLREPDQADACGEFLPGSVYRRDPARNQPPEVEVNGIPFWKDEVLEGVMGEFYRRISYRTEANGACYQLTQLLHYRNPDIIPNVELELFDESAVLARLDSVLETFSFLDVQPSFPKLSYPEAKTFSEALPKDASPHVDGLDVSHWQGDIRWGPVSRAGYEFVFIKGTEGVGWTDVKFFENIQESTDAGVLAGIYHFARPDLNNSGREEAEYFLEVSGDYLRSGYLRPVLDLEVRGSLGKTALTNWTMEWLDTVKNRTGVSPLIYTNLNFINNYLNDEITEYDLWIAYWTCEPEPSYNIPPTGKYRDWAFWQYSGPGGCGSNAGYVPGIETNIDLNIFNGVSSGLAEYDAASQLWVSLTSDAYLVPRPYYADITANVNGDAAGPIDFAFWWDCSSLEADLQTVEAECGELPVPEEGTCQENEVGMRCLGVDNERQLAEHTYQEIGDYSPKVIVERPDEGPAEDRYKISTYNPLRSIKTDLPTPGEETIQVPYPLEVKVDLHTILDGALQVEIIDQQTGEVEDQQCKLVPGDAKDKYYFNQTWTESETGLRWYQIQARYRDGGSCPVEDSHENDLSIDYLIDWQDPEPVLEIQRPAGTVLDPDVVDPVGSHEMGRTVEVVYWLENAYPTRLVEVSDVTSEQYQNISAVSIAPETPLEVPPGGGTELIVSFQIDQPGPFSADLVLEHDASNLSPYRITLEGEGTAAPDAIQAVSIDPSASGQAWVGDSYHLQAVLDVDIPADGALQAEVVDGDQVLDRLCRQVPAGLEGSQVFDLAWTGTESGEQAVEVGGRYRAGGSCPVEDQAAEDLSASYQVSWQEDPPALTVKQLDGTVISAEEALSLGEVEFYQTISVEYRLENTSTTNGLVVDGIDVSSSDHLSNASVEPAGSFEIAPGEVQPLTVTFRASKTGSFSLDLSADHQGSSLSPFSWRVQGQVVMSADPLETMTLDPAVPGNPWIGEDFSFSVSLAGEIPAPGSAAVSVLDESSGTIREESCRLVEQNQSTPVTFPLTWTETLAGEREYTIEARYQAGGGCPQAGTPDDQLTENYQLVWREETPALTVQRPVGTNLGPGSEDPLGEYEFYQTLELSYNLHNPSRTTPLDVSRIRAENLTGLREVEISPSSGIVVGAGESAAVTVSFRVESTGSFGFDLVFDHDGGNASPYQIQVVGSGVMTENWITYLTPDPLPPAASLIHDPFQLGLEVGLNVPDRGALLVAVEDQASGAAAAEICREVESNFSSAQSFQLDWVEAAPGERSYQIFAQYQVGGSCPFSGIADAERSHNYQIRWEEIQPSLELRREDGTLLPAGSFDQRGQSGLGEIQQVSYLLVNPSPTSMLRVSDVSVQNPVNLEMLEVDLSAPLTLAPEEGRSLTVTYRTQMTGAYSFDLIVEHNGTGSSPHRLAVRGGSELISSPLQSITLDPASPNRSWVGDPYVLDAEVVIDPPVDGVLQVSVIESASGEIRHSGCVTAPAGGTLINSFEFLWSEATPGTKNYQVLADFQIGGGCPLDEQDAQLSADFQITWEAETPALEVRRPEGVTVFPGGEDYIGRHHWFNFVRVSYVLENTSRTTPLELENIYADNLVSLRRVQITPAAPITLQPGEQETIEVVFLILTDEPFSLDLIFEHTGSPLPQSQLEVYGEGYLDVENEIKDPWVYRFLTRLIDRGFFLRLPEYILDLLEGYLA